jgi:hypothetical protein
MLCTSGLPYGLATRGGDHHRTRASVPRSQRIMPIQAVLLFVLAQLLASLSIDEVQLGASGASDPFIFVQRTCTSRRAGLAEGL